MGWVSQWCVCVHMQRMHTCVCVRPISCLCVFVCLCVCVSVCMRACVCARTYACVCAALAFVCTHMSALACMRAAGGRLHPAPCSSSPMSVCVRACVRACVLLCAGASPGQGSARVWAHGGQRRWHAPPACPTPPQPPPAAAHAPRRAPHA